jgi:1-phosphofructokinase
MNGVVIFAPSPVLTVTVEDHADGSDVHVHAGGQGVWQARMLLALGTPVTLCSVLIGEAGRVLAHLAEDEGIRLVAVKAEGRGGTYVHDRRGGERAVIAESDGDALSRHDLDQLYGMTLREGLDAESVILSATRDDGIVPADTYRRLASDLRANGTRVIVDLTGERLAAALAGGVDVAKISDEELLAEGRVTGDTTEELLAAMNKLRGQGADAVVVTREERPVLLLTESGATELTGPTLEVADARGAGDSLTAGIASALGEGSSIEDAVTTGVAAGALNVTRHGLGTGDPDAIAALRERVQARPLGTAEKAARVTPHDLAGMATEEPS